MPHSKAKSKAITNRLRSIDRTVKRLKKVNTKKLQEAEVIFHSKVRLGTLRDSFSPHHKKIRHIYSRTYPNSNVFHQILHVPFISMARMEGYWHIEGL